MVPPKQVEEWHPLRELGQVVALMKPLPAVAAMTWDMVTGIMLLRPVLARHEEGREGTMCAAPQPPQKEAVFTREGNPGPAGTSALS